MHDEVLELAANSWAGMALNLILILVISSLLCALSIRLLISIAATERIKARKDWRIGSVAGLENPLLARLIGKDQAPPVPLDLLNEEVKRLLDQCGSCNSLETTDADSERNAGGIAKTR